MAAADIDTLNSAWTKVKSSIDALSPVEFCLGHLLLWASGTFDACDLHTCESTSARHALRLLTLSAHPCTYCQSKGEPCLELHARFNRVLRQLIRMRSSEITVKDKNGNDKVVREFTPQQCRGYARKVSEAYSSKSVAIPAPHSR